MKFHQLVLKFVRRSIRRFIRQSRYASVYWAAMNGVTTNRMYQEFTRANTLYELADKMPNCSERNRVYLQAVQHNKRGWWLLNTIEMGVPFVGYDLVEYGVPIGRKVKGQ